MAGRTEEPGGAAYTTGLVLQSLPEAGKTVLATTTLGFIVSDGRAPNDLGLR